MLHEYHVIYSVQYYPRFHVTAVERINRGYGGTYIYVNFEAPSDLIFPNPFQRNITFQEGTFSRRWGCSQQGRDEVKCLCHNLAKARKRNTVCGYDVCDPVPTTNPSICLPVKFCTRNLYNQASLAQAPLVIIGAVTFSLYLRSSFFINSYFLHLFRYAVAQSVEALRYKSEGRGFKFRWRHWNFSLT
jgi:hypothetical protein